MPLPRPTADGRSFLEAGKVVDSHSGPGIEACFVPGRAELSRNVGYSDDRYAKTRMKLEMQANVRPAMGETAGDFSPDRPEEL